MGVQTKAKNPTRHHSKMEWEGGIRGASRCREFAGRGGSMPPPPPPEADASTVRADDFGMKIAPSALEMAVAMWR